LSDAFEIIRLLGNQWHPQAEKALTVCYLTADDPLNGWASLAISKYYTYSSLVNVKRILTKEREEHFADHFLRARAEAMLTEVE
jgi:hypothetical protein